MTKRGEVPSKPLGKTYSKDDVIWKLISSIDAEFSRNNGWFYSEGLFYVMGDEGTMIYTPEEFEKIKDKFNGPGNNTSK